MAGAAESSVNGVWEIGVDVMDKGVDIFHSGLIHLELFLTELQRTMILLGVSLKFNIDT